MKLIIGRLFGIREMFRVSVFRMIILFALAFISIIAYVNIYNVSLSAREVKTDSGVSKSSRTCQFSDDKIIRQGFYIHQKSTLNSIKIKMSVKNVTVSSFNLSIRDKRDNVLYEKNISVSEVTDSEYLSVNVDGVSLNGTDRYFVVLTAERESYLSDITPRVWMCKSDDVNDVLYIGSSISDGSALDVTYNYTTVPVGVREIVMIAVIIVILVMAVLIKRQYILKLLMGYGVAAAIYMWIHLWYCTDTDNIKQFDVQTAMITSVVLLIMIISFRCVHKYAHIDNRLKHFVDIKSDNKKIVNIVGVVARVLFWLAIFGCQIAIAYRLYQRIGWDVDTIYKIAKELYYSGGISNYASYLKLYPNNRAMVMIVYFIMKVTGDARDSVVYWHLVVCNIALIDVAIAMMYRVCKRLFGIGTAVISLVIALILLGLSGWMIVPYTDTMSAWMPMAQICLYINAKDRENGWKRVVCVSSMGALSVIGYYIKPQCVIVVIAIVIVQVMHHRKSLLKDIRRKLVSVCLFATGFMLGIVVFCTSATYILGQDADTGISVPAVHFLMMGADENPAMVGIGGYDLASTNYTFSYGQTADKKMKCLERYISIMKQYGVAGYISHVFEKTAWILGDGSFAWQVEGSFYQDDYSVGHAGWLQNLVRNMYYGSHGYYKDDTMIIHFGVVSGIWFVVLAFCIIPVGRTKDNSTKIVIYLAIAGCVAFAIIFEGRARYLINYIPFFCIVAASSLKTFITSK